MQLEDLQHLKDAAHDYLLREARPLPTSAVARHLFGARRHEMPETQVVVKALLRTDPRFVETHDQYWTVLGSSALMLPLNEAKFVVIDLETTGSVIGVDEIIEVGLVAMRGDKIIDRFESLVWTDRAIPPWVRRLTGIRNDDLIGAPTFSDISEILLEHMDGSVFVAHDIRFDLPFLRWEFGRRGLPIPEVTGLCTLQLSRALWPGLSSRSLPELANRFEIVHDNPHRAAADAAAAAGVLHRAVTMARELGAVDLGDLFRLRVEEDAEAPAARAAES